MDEGRRTKDEGRRGKGEINLRRQFWFGEKEDIMTASISQNQRLSAVKKRTL
jgi:hypothetical protein